MNLLRVFEALLLTLVSLVASQAETITVDITTLMTITSCYSTVSNCPASTHKKSSSVHLIPRSSSPLRNSTSSVVRSTRSQLSTSDKEASQYSTQYPPSSYGQVTAPPQYRSTVTSPPGSESTSHCTYGRCLQQILHASVTAEEFCTTYTQTVNTQCVYDQANFLSDCSDSPSAVSSACTCLMSRTQSHKATSTSGIAQATRSSLVSLPDEQRTSSLSGSSSASVSSRFSKSAIGTFQSVPPETFTTVLTSGTSFITSVFTSAPPQRPSKPQTFTTVLTSGTSLITSTFVSVPSPSKQPETFITVLTSGASKITSISTPSLSVQPKTFTTVLTSGTSKITSVFASAPSLSEQSQTFTSVLTSGTSVFTSVFTSLPTPSKQPETFTSVFTSGTTPSGPTDRNSASQAGSSLSGGRSGQSLTPFVSAGSTMTRPVSSASALVGLSTGQSLTTFVSRSLTTTQAVSPTSLPEVASGTAQPFKTFTSGGSVTTLAISSTIPPGESPSAARSFTTFTSGGSIITQAVPPASSPESNPIAAQSFTTFTSKGSVITQPETSSAPIQSGSAPAASGTSGIPPAISFTVVSSGGSLATVPVSSAQSSISAGFSISIPHQESAGGSSMGGSNGSGSPASSQNSHSAAPESQKSAGPEASSDAQPPSSSGKNNPDGSSKIPASTTPPSAGATPTSSGALQTSMTGSGNVSTVSVTGTATLPTDGLSYQETSGLAGDQWITVITNGHTSVGLAVHGRNGHHYEIIWGLFSLLFSWEWNKRYDLRFPDLNFDLSFHWPKFPCVFFCGGGAPEPPIEDPPPKNEKSEPSKSSQSTSSRSSSSSSSCSVATVTGCLTSSIYLVDSQGSTTSTITTKSCSTVSTCSITASSSTTTSTSSASATPTYYLIIPNNDKPRDVVTSFTERLKAETNASTLWISDAPAADFTAFWCQYLNSTQVDTYKQSPAVAAITPKFGKDFPDEQTTSAKGTILEKRTLDQRHHNHTNTYASFDWEELEKRIFVPPPPPRDDYIQEYGRGQDIIALSQPPPRYGPMWPVPKLEDLATFSHEQQPPKQARVYILDSGCDVNSIAYLRYTEVMGQEPDWLFAGQTVPADVALGAPFEEVWVKSDLEINENPHGTSVFSKVFGALGATEDSLATIPVPPEPLIPFGTFIPGYRWPCVIDGLRQILNDVAKRNTNGDLARGNAVLIAPFGIPIRMDNPSENALPTEPGVDPEWLLHYQLYQKMLFDQVVIVQTSGNGGESTTRAVALEMNDMPAVWKNEDLPLLIVGAVDNNGIRTPWTQWWTPDKFPGAHIDVYAAGDDVEVDMPGGKRELASGTSFAAPVVAGLISYFLSCPGHRAAIDGAFQKRQALSPRGDDWAKAVIDYVKALAWARDPVKFPNARMVWNGAIPKSKEDKYACPGSFSYPDIEKCQALQCAVPPDPSLDLPPGVPEPTVPLFSMVLTIPTSSVTGIAVTPLTDSSTTVPVSTTTLPPTTITVQPSPPTAIPSTTTTFPAIPTPPTTPPKPHATCVTTFFDNSGDDASVYIMADFNLTAKELPDLIGLCINDQGGVKYWPYDFQQDNLTPQGDPWKSTNILEYKVSQVDASGDPNLWPRIVQQIMANGGPSNMGWCAPWSLGTPFNPPPMSPA
ncbi:uncharacterized protein PAC_09055 [Phialocephala subalpina]|uniref:Peptidase S8/S53 domain-containing protein n=1 Tax=Phialocephala subalpina TaxID=576137 RepID=A0A1L7X2A9_9HELO|nr:uncharacterized protein PAC_09055 [Phialocephala subalpina]